MFEIIINKNKIRLDTIKLDSSTPVEIEIREEENNKIHYRIVANNERITVFKLGKILKFTGFENE